MATAVPSYATTANTVVTVQQMIDQAYRDAGKYAEEITPEYANAARLALYYNLINLSNRGVNLWLLDYILVGSEARKRAYSMPVGTVDVREANYRYQIRPQPKNDTSGVGIYYIQSIDPVEEETRKSLQKSVNMAFEIQTRS
jgi:hypothetical protein